MYKTLLFVSLNVLVAMLLQQQTSTEELVRHSAQASSIPDTDHENHQLPVSGPIGGDHSHLRDVAQLTDSMSAACSLSDRY